MVKLIDDKDDEDAIKEILKVLIDTLIEVTPDFDTFNERVKSFNIVEDGSNIHFKVRNTVFFNDTTAVLSNLQHMVVKTSPDPMLRAQLEERLVIEEDIIITLTQLIAALAQTYVQGHPAGDLGMDGKGHCVLLSLLFVCIDRGKFLSTRKEVPNRRVIIELDK